MATAQMTSAPQCLVAKLSREEVANLEVGRTDVSRAQAWYLCGMFLVTIFGVPVAQQAWELRGQGVGSRGVDWPQCYDIVVVVKTAVREFESAPGSFLDRVVAANRIAVAGIQRYERELEDQSLLGQRLLPWTQWCLTNFLGAGNDETYIGRDRWLFYRPDVDSITGPPYLEPLQLRQRELQAASGASVQADPRRAIIQFHEQLAARGIRLVVMPTPSKPAIHPEKISVNLTPADAPIENPSYQQLMNDLREHGVLAFDPTDAILAARRPGAPAYLESDTHWTPVAAEAAAAALARWIGEQKLLPPSAPQHYRLEPDEVENVGDVAVMLRLPAWQTLYPLQRVQLQTVVRANGAWWSPDRSADVLLLGDSFTNIYSLAAMGWGESAGFAEQLSVALERPLDCIVRNDAGAHATRQALSRELARGRDRLAGKRLVIWQFAARELSNGDWKRLPMTLKAPPPASFLVAKPKQELVVSGTVATISPAPRPGRVPYKDHILAIHLVDVELRSPDNSGGSDSNSQCIVYMWSMIDSIRQPAARYRAGQRLTLRLRSWTDVESHYGAINRTELDDLELQLEEPNWGEALP